MSPWPKPNRRVGLVLMTTKSRHRLLAPRGATVPAGQGARASASPLSPDVLSGAPGGAAGASAPPRGRAAGQRCGWQRGRRRHGCGGPGAGVGAARRGGGRLRRAAPGWDERDAAQVQVGVCARGSARRNGAGADEERNRGRRRRAVCKVAAARRRPGERRRRACVAWPRGRGHRLHAGLWLARSVWGRRGTTQGAGGD